MENSTTLFKLLAADHRRKILFLLCNTDSIQLPEGLLTRGETHAQHPQNTDSCSPPGQLTSIEDTSLDRMQIQLRHIHLPKLEDEGVIEWNQDTQTVSRGPRFEEIEPVLRLLAANQSRFPNDLF